MTRRDSLVTITIQTAFSGIKRARKGHVYPSTRLTPPINLIDTGQPAEPIRDRASWSCPLEPAITLIAERSLTLLDTRSCKELLAQLERTLKSMRLRIQDHQDNTSDSTITLKAVEQAHWWTSEVGSRLPI